MNKIDNILQRLSNKYASKWLVFLFDLCVIVFTFFLAYIIRYNFKFDFDIEIFLKQIPFVVAAAAISILIVGSYKGVVRFTGTKDVINLVVGLNILATILIISTFTSRKFHFDTTFDIPGSIIYIHLLLNMFFLITIKFYIKTAYRNLFENFGTKKNTLIYGAGTSGMITYEALSNDPKSETKIIGFIDDDKQKIGKQINVLRVYGLDHITPEFVASKNLEQVIISMHNVDSEHLLHISNTFLDIGVKVKTVPPLNQWVNGNFNLKEIKDLNIEDLLGRHQIQIDNPLLVQEYTNKVLLVTGAAGSIGSELTRRLSKYQYKHLILVDNSESALYNIQQELVQNQKLNITAIVADVRDYKRLETIFSKHKPEIVFHAAAYKHVPLMEKNPFEAVKVNILGSYNTANLSSIYGVEKFVFISTDKAVNPTNVMGATKRIAEMYISSLSELQPTKTKFIITRFGNVLGSNGSVIPLFKKQIKAGGPLTVTHKDIIRYFMTIPEACALVLEAAAMGSGQEIYVFDMGKPVKILDLAKNMITLSGLKYPQDIDIKIVGLRPGEKIYEELLIDGENSIPTYNDKIMIARCKPIDANEFYLQLNTLLAITSKTQNIEIVSKIKDIVPEYTPNNTNYDVLNRLN